MATQLYFYILSRQKPNSSDDVGLWHSPVCVQIYVFDRNPYIFEFLILFVAEDGIHRLSIFTFQIVLGACVVPLVSWVSGSFTLCSQRSEVVLPTQKDNWIVSVALRDTTINNTGPYVRLIIRLFWRSEGTQPDRIARCLQTKKHSESEIYRAPIYMQMVSLFYSNYIVW